MIRTSPKNQKHYAATCFFVRVDLFLFATAPIFLAVIQRHRSVSLSSRPCTSVSRVLRPRWPACIGPPAQIKQVTQ